MYIGLVSSIHESGSDFRRHYGSCSMDFGSEGLVINLDHSPIASCSDTSDGKIFIVGLEHCVQHPTLPHQPLAFPLSKSV